MNNPNIRFISKDKFKFQKNLPLVIGFFDGVHKGHLNLFKKINSKFNVLTFENVPAKNKTIFTLAARLTNLSFVSKWLQNIYVYDIKKNNDVNFFINLLKKEIKPSKIIVGRKFKFGPGRSSNVDVLKKDFNVITVGENKLTSSKIKQYLMNGDLLKVNKSLTSPYYVYGEVIHGNKNGGKLGFKTANIKLEDNLVALKEGSYIGFSSVNKKMYQSAIFIRNGILESHILNGFNKNIYGKRLIVYPLLFTRPITKVNSFEELRKTITKKIKEIQTLFSKF